VADYEQITVPASTFWALKITIAIENKKKKDARFRYLLVGPRGQANNRGYFKRYSTFLSETRASFDLQ
jgi:hypothetical protein